MYLIKKGNKYVALAGSKNSYTTSIRRARRFPTREAADADCCPGNERVVSVAYEMTH